jgi:seryl-tRNA synthetase
MSRYSKELSGFLKLLDQEKLENLTKRNALLTITSSTQKRLEESIEQIPVIFQKHSDEKGKIAATALQLDEDTKTLTKLLKNVQIDNQKVIEKHMEMIKKEQQMEANVESYCREIEEKSKAVEMKREELTNSIDKLTKASDHFKKYLGLEFKKTTNDAVLIVFRSIDPLKPDSAYTCQLKVVDRVYVVLSTHPELGDISEELKKLNANNNLLSFLVKIRRRCQQLAQKRG